MRLSPPRLGPGTTHKARPSRGAQGSTRAAPPGMPGAAQAGRGVDRRRSSRGSWRLTTLLRAASSGPSPHCPAAQAQLQSGGGKGRRHPGDRQGIHVGSCRSHRHAVCRGCGSPECVRDHAQVPREGRAEWLSRDTPPVTQGGQDLMPQAAASGRAGPSGQGLAAAFTPTRVFLTRPLILSWAELKWPFKAQNSLFTSHQTPQTLDSDPTNLEKMKDPKLAHPRPPTHRGAPGGLQAQPTRCRARWGGPSIWRTGEGASKATMRRREELTQEWTGGDKGTSRVRTKVLK